MKTKNGHISHQCEIFSIKQPDIPIFHPKYFGQCAEDYIVLSILRSYSENFGIDLTKLKYCEIGANHPISSSATYLLHTGLGMSGVLVEANSDLIEGLYNVRGHSDKIVNCAIVPNSIKSAKINKAYPDELSSLDAEFINKFSPINGKNISVQPVSAMTLDALILSEFKDQNLAFLSIDIEGLDAKVLASYSFLVRPFIIQIEGAKEHDIDAFCSIKDTLNLNGYTIIARTDVNQIAIDSRVLNFPHSTPAYTLPRHIQCNGSRDETIFSIDVFDTVLFRKCLKPTDVFEWMERKHGWAGFCEARVRAESRARQLHSDRGGEVSLEEIYEQMPSIFAGHGGLMQAELDAEKQFLYASEEIREFINEQKASNKRLIAVSDMYLGSQQISELLVSNQIYVDRVYCSSDYRSINAGKYNGKLYSLVEQVEVQPPANFFHVGDNVRSDVDNARAAGWQSENVIPHHHIIQHNETLALLSKKPHDFVSSMVIGHAFSMEESQKNVSGHLTSYGRYIGGPLLYGFIKFLLHRAEKDGISHFVFLERDGLIVSSLFDELNPEGITYRTLPCSRRLSIFPTVCASGIGAIEKIFDPSELITTKRFFEVLAIDCPHINASHHDLLTPRQIYMNYKDYINLKSDNEKKLLLDELGPEIDMARSGGRFAWVDVGWSLSSISALNKIIGMDIHCYCVGSSQYVDRTVSHDGFLFSQGTPDTISNPVMRAAELIELIFSWPKESALFFEAADNSVLVKRRPFSPLERSRSAAVAEVVSGALSFARSFHQNGSVVEWTEMRQYNIDVLIELIDHPPCGLYAALASIPHDRFAGVSGWDYVGSYWKSHGVKTDRISWSPVSAQGLAFNEHSICQWDRLVYHCISVALVFRRLLPQRTSSRLKRSRQKRLLRLKSQSKKK